MVDFFFFNHMEKTQTLTCKFPILWCPEHKELNEEIGDDDQHQPSNTVDTQADFPASFTVIETTLSSMSSKDHK